jgi:hypothetical protein
MLLRNIVCSLVLAAFVYGLNRALNGAFTDFGFIGGAAIGIGFCVLVVIAAFAWDRHEARQQSFSQGLPPQPPQYSPPLARLPHSRDGN